MNTPGLDPVALHRRATQVMDEQVRRLRPEHWTAATPCPDWDVHALVNHVVTENRWTAPLLAGRTPAEVGSSLDGDQLGTNPADAWCDTVSTARAAAAALGATDCVVHLSSGDISGAEYLRQLAADHLLHAWDLATAAGGDTELDPDLVTAVGGWFLGRESTYRAAGLVGPRPPVEHDQDPQTRLLAMFGRTTGPKEPTTPHQDTIAAVERFSAAFGRQDLDAVMAAMTEDCVFESTAPPDGVRHVGQPAVRAAWAQFFTSAPDAEFEPEETLTCGDRVIVRWLFRWNDGHVRGVDIFRTRGQLVAEKLSYVKG